MNVFVLCTGRCGSVTFAKACSHFTNYTVGHETRGDHGRQTRVAFPPNHIEVDLRLTFCMGLLEEHFGKDAFYVHLTRDHDAVVASYRRKWEKRGEKAAGILGAWRLIHHQPTGDVVPVMIDDMIAVMNSNIKAFLRDKDHMCIDLAGAKNKFPAFAARLGARGNMSAALREFDTIHNAGKAA